MVIPTIIYRVTKRQKLTGIKTVDITKASFPLWKLANEKIQKEARRLNLTPRFFSNFTTMIAFIENQISEKHMNKRIKWGIILTIGIGLSGLGIYQFTPHENERVNGSRCTAQRE